LLIAGGAQALQQAVESAEDSADAGAARVAEVHVGTDDVVLGLAASGNTPFTVGAVKAARQRGALTIGIANNAGSALPGAADHAVVIDTGAEPIAGSTRLKAGPAQKKLRRRAIRMVMTIAGCNEAEATKALAAGGDSVKLAALIALGGGTAAQALLDKHGGNLRRAMSEIEPRKHDR
jgi:N-acetylmuramic acid 6-phosphate etherase